MRAIDCSAVNAECAIEAQRVGTGVRPDGQIAARLATQIQGAILHLELLMHPPKTHCGILGGPAKC
jgi:hypothetical protein